MEEEEARPKWEQDIDETPRAYAAFCLYRDLGPTRTLDKAYTRYRQSVEATEGAQRGYSDNARAPRAWRTWWTDNVWKERAIAYDRHIDRLNREKREEEHRKLLLGYQERTRALSVVGTNAAISLTRFANHKMQVYLDEIDNKPLPDPDEEGLTESQREARRKTIQERRAARTILDNLTPHNIAYLLRVASMVGAGAANAEAMSLGVNVLLENLDAERIES